MITCAMCGKPSPESRTLEGICLACRERHWLPPHVPPRRPLVPCSRCQGRSFVRGRVVRERGAAGQPVLVASADTGAVVKPFVAWLAVTFQHDTSRTFWANREVDQPDPNKPAGIFEVYVCRGCGFVEWYVVDADRIPIGPEYATDLFELPSDGGPYR